MYKLLDAGFARIKKDKIFWGAVIITFGVALLKIYNYALNDLKYDADSLIFGYINIIGMVKAVFTSIFIGTEYDCGTIRNKIVVRA